MDRTRTDTRPSVVKHTKKRPTHADKNSERYDKIFAEAHDKHLDRPDLERSRAFAVIRDKNDTLTDPRKWMGRIFQKLKRPLNPHNPQRENLPEFWTHINTCQTGVWFTYDSDKEGKLNRAVNQYIKDKLQNTYTTNGVDTYFEWATRDQTIRNGTITQHTANQKTGDIGEYSIYFLLQAALHPLPLLSYDEDIANDYIPDLYEEGDPIDISFVCNKTFIHNCVKTSKNKERRPSSEQFKWSAWNDLSILHYKTIVIRWRISFVEIYNPLGHRAYIEYLVTRNF